MRKALFTLICLFAMLGRHGPESPGDYDYLKPWLDMDRLYQCRGDEYFRRFGNLCPHGGRYFKIKV